MKRFQTLFKAPKLRPTVYAPSWRQAGKGGRWSTPLPVVPKVKVKSHLND